MVAQFFRPLLTFQRSLQNHLDWPQYISSLTLTLEEISGVEIRKAPEVDQPLSHPNLSFLFDLLLPKGPSGLLTLFGWA